MSSRTEEVTSESFSTTSRLPVTIGRGSWSRAAAKELGLIGALYGLYRLGRWVADGQESRAREYARLVHSFETQVHIPSGAEMQGWFGDELLHLANVYYVSAHFPVTIVFLLWGFIVRPRDEYLWARNVLALQTLLAMLLHIAIPLAPPRMFPEWGFSDTMATIGPSAYHGASAAISNQLAAMPSLHVGWAVLIAVVVARTAVGPLRLFAGAHAVITTWVVIVTANHWWSDGVVAVALLGVALYVFPTPGRPGRLGRLVGHRVSAPRAHDVSSVGRLSQRGH